MLPHISLLPGPKFSGLLSFLSRLTLETAHSLSCYTLKLLYSCQTSSCLHLPQEVRAEFWHNLYATWKCMAFPSGSAGKEPTSQCRRHRGRRFNPWVRKILCWRKWQPALVFLPGKSHGQKSLAGCSLWSLTELDTTELLSANTHSIHTTPASSKPE